MTTMMCKQNEKEIHVEFDNAVQVFESRGRVAKIGPLTMSIKRGEIVTIVGHSGCGKTTLLNLIAGLIQPTEGTIKIDGKAVERPYSSCGYVFQEFSLFPWRTARQNVEFGLELRGIDRAKRHERALECLELVGLRTATNSYPRELSGGMKQRVAIARALAYESSILLMDEPFGSLDAQTREEMQIDLLDIWANTHKTIIFVTHSINEAVFLGSRVFIMTAPDNTIAATYEMPMGYPRGIETKSSAELNAVAYKIRTMLAGRREVPACQSGS
jgi:NitT/TauT family transport system ATP-binding protein